MNRCTIQVVDRSLEGAGQPLMPIY